MKAILPILLLTVLSLGACSHPRTKIYTRPSGAELITDHNKSLGRAPIELSEPVWIWSKRKVKAVMPGYQPREIVMENTGVNAGRTVACICTAGILLPHFLRSTYLPQYAIELVPIEEKSAKLEFKKTISFHE